MLLFGTKTVDPETIGLQNIIKKNLTKTKTICTYSSSITGGTVEQPCVNSIGLVNENPSFLTPYRFNVP